MKSHNSHRSTTAAWLIAWACALTTGAGHAAEPTSAPPRAAAASQAAPQAAASSGIKGLTGARRRADGALVISGTLSGNGTIVGTGTRVITGKVSPGNSPGCVSDQGNVVFEGSSSLEIEIGGTAACSQFDQYSVALTLTLNGPTLNVVLVNGFVPADGQRFDVLNWGTLAGTFGQVNLPALPGGLQWDASSLYTTGELVVSSPTSAAGGDVPLPPWSLALLGAGLLGSLVKRRRS